MNKPIYFSPYEELSSQENLNAFISLCKYKLTVFGENLLFDSNVWDITNYIEVKKTTKTIIHFINLEEARIHNNKKKTSSVKYLEEPFLSFAKAYIRYRQGMQPIKNIGIIITSLRLIEHTLLELKGHADSTDVSADILTRAAQIALEYYSDSVAYRLGQLLEELGQFLTQKRIVRIPIDWKNSIKRPCDTQRVGKKADENRNKKMPSKLALESLPHIFFDANEPKDIIIISIIALLLGAPNRINEVLFLSYDCEITQKDSQGKEQYGLQWYPAKGAEPMIKWIIPSMVDVVKLAINRIRKLTEPFRAIAKWYEEHPDSMHIPENLEYLRKKEYLNSNEAQMLLFGKTSPISLTYWLKQHNIPYVTSFKEEVTTSVLSPKMTKFRFRDFEKAVLNLLPRNFPYLNKEIGIKYSKALVVTRRNEFHSQKATLLPTVTSLTIEHINDALGSRFKELSIFEKYGYREKDGSQIKVTTHQFRHYLNTLAQKGGASQLDIAKWSGRKEVKQNATYDHISTDEMLTLTRNAMGDERSSLLSMNHIDDIKKKIVISRDEYAELKVRTAHRTNFGICIHDFSMMPCQLHMDCINCTEQICIKGDTFSYENIKSRKTDVQRLLEIAMQEHNSGHISAQKWVQHHSIELTKLTQLCDIMENPNVPHGAVIQINNISSSLSIQTQNQKNTTHEQPLSTHDLKNLLLQLGNK